MKCLIVLPCYNEEENIRQVVRSIDTILGTQVPYRIIAVDDGSRDRTGEALKDLSSEFPVGIFRHSRNLGLGAALKTGLLAAAEEASCDDFIVTMDSDNTHDPKHILDMLDAAEKASIVVGSRYVKGGVQLNVPPHRVVLSRIINLLVGELFHLHVRDATSGFRCFRAALIKRLCVLFRDSIIESDGFSASLELLLKATGSGAVVAEVPISLDYGKKGGRSKMRLFSTIMKYLGLLYKHRVMNSLKHPG